MAAPKHIDTPKAPDLRQRAAGLRGELAKPRKPRPVDWSNPPPGFMASPALAPTAFVRIEDGIRIEADRLLGIAVAEFRRHWQPSAELRDDAAHAAEGKRLRKALQIEALGAIAAPNMIEITGWRYVEETERGLGSVAVPSGGSDAELRVLGRTLDVACAAWRAAVEAAQEPWTRRDQLIRERGSSSIKVLREAEGLPGVEAATDAEDTTFSTVIGICDAIWKLPAQTPAGLAVKARAALVDIWPNGDFEATAAEGDEEGLSNQSARRLIEACCALAGVDWQGEPIWPETGAAVADARQEEA